MLLYFRAVYQKCDYYATSEILHHSPNHHGRQPWHLHQHWEGHLCEAEPDISLADTCDSLCTSTVVLEVLPLEVQQPENQESQSDKGDPEHGIPHLTMQLNTVVDITRFSSWYSAASTASSSAARSWTRWAVCSLSPTHEAVQHVEDEGNGSYREEWAIYTCWIKYTTHLCRFYVLGMKSETI